MNKEWYFLDFGTINVPLPRDLEIEIELGIRDIRFLLEEIRFQAELEGGRLVEGPPQRILVNNNLSIWKFPAARPRRWVLEWYGWPSRREETAAPGFRQSP